MDNHTTMPALLTQPAPLGSTSKSARTQPLYKLIFVLALLVLVAFFLLG